MTDQGTRQTQTGSTAPPEPARDIRSADAIMSVNQTARLQQAAQGRINAGRHDHIGEAP